MKLDSTSTALALALTLAACGSSQTPRTIDESDLHELNETRAVTLISETLLDQGYQLRAGGEIDVGWEEPLEVDVQVVGAKFGVEWVSQVDHHQRGDDIPPPAPDGQLRIVSGRGGSAGMHVLVLDTNTYKFHPSRENVQAGGAGAREVEARVRRDVRDFVEFERGRTE